MWMTILVMLVSYFLTKKKTGSSTKAALVAGLAGAGTYYAQHETDWGKANLNALDGDADTTETKPVLDADGKPVQNPDGSGVLTTAVKGATDVLKSWGGTGTAAVIGTTAVASSSSLQKYIPWAIAAAVAIMVLK